MSDSGAIAAVVLAAGRSRRFGADKLLQPAMLNDLLLPIAAHSLQPWLAIFDQISVVTGADSEILRHTLEKNLPEEASRIRWILCKDADAGMSRSIAAGISAHWNADGWLIGLADMPAVPQSVIARVVEGIASGALLAAPYKEGRRGHPVGFASIYRDRLMSLQGDAGARTLLHHETDNILRIETDDDGIFTDIDIPQDLEKLSGLSRN